MQALAPLPATSDAAAPAHAQAVAERVLALFAAAHADCTDAASDPRLAGWLADASGMAVADPTQWHTDEVDVSLIPFAEGQRRLCAALRPREGALQLVLADPFDTGTRLWLEARIRAAGHPPTEWSVAVPAAMAAFFTRLERELRALDVQVAELPGLIADDDEVGVIELSLADISASENPVVRFVNSTLYDALKARASDIHLECAARGLAVKYRLDGVLQTITRTDGREFADRVVSRVKVLADLDISERRVPQDGRLKLRLGSRAIDVRVSLMPSLYGEDAVLRILDRYQIAADERLSIQHLSFSASEAAFIRRMAHLPYGLFLVTGPTGSGKTTTLYGVLSEVNTGLDKIITIEDPVEYQVPDILQIPVNEAKGLTFARGLRSILRHDPDKIMVGEMRDAETAQIAIQAALTGHQVFATVHANNVFDVIGRLSTMQIDPYNLVSALNGVLAQRLMRLVCTHCATPEQPDAERRAASQLPPEAAGWRFVRGVGCEHCRGTGYKGRRAIAQTLAMDVELRSLIAERASPARLRDAARARGLRTLRDAALALVAAGTTTLEEADRVTAVEE
ncbi:Type II secretion system protein E [Rubrivivax sp. A210]|uniref:GspE/PulE family protein n=1 Tax=Rubrivivax sp. A210 TaxID=2772301 RepID=UPI00191B1092|nr:GspE/PulE family protein [Rubrivivax sp. A210]CAD5373349.1 Type II secretion system protein E [Rubrivivax sp. A210]